ncbi:MAG: VWA domain-containing protein [bacterium]|nr:VWA domain-containing protein [bacterium]
MMKKRMTALALGICMTVGMLGGCGQEKARNDDSHHVESGSHDAGQGTSEGGTVPGIMGADTAAPESEAAGGADGVYPAENNGYAGDMTADAGISCDAAEAESGYAAGAPCEDDAWAPYENSAPMSYENEPYGNESWEAPYGDEFTEITENPFLDVREQPLSTFSADVDTASYSYLRRMIEEGYAPEWIPRDSVRIEEMLNYFSYDYHGPRAGEPFGVNTEIAACPWNEDSYLLQIGLQTEQIDFSDAPASNLVFLIDVSGSMYDADKLPLLQQSFAMLASNLTAKDRVSIVTYAGEDEVVLTGAKGNETDRIVNALNALTASGSTNGGAGIMTAYSIAQDYFIEGGNNRIILATDGDLNVGLTSVEELERLVETERRSGVFLTVLGFGTGNLKDNRMETLADKGNGNYAYIDSLSEAKKVLVEELGATVVTVAKDVKLQMEFNSGVVSEYRLIGYENRALAAQDFADDTKDAGEIGAGHSVTALYEVRLVRGNMQSALARGNVGTLHIRCKKPDGERSVQFDYEIGRESYGRTPSTDIRFAAGVAAFGMVLRESEYCGEFRLRDVLDMLEELHLGEDEYKQEFVDLVGRMTANDEWSRALGGWEEDGSGIW